MKIEFFSSFHTNFKDNNSVHSRTYLDYLTSPFHQTRFFFSKDFIYARAVHVNTSENEKLTRHTYVENGIWRLSFYTQNNALFTKAVYIFLIKYVEFVSAHSLTLHHGS